MAVMGNKKILLAIDGSNEAMSMVQYVAKMLPPADTKVVLFHMFSKIPESFWDSEKNVEVDFWMNKMQALEEEHAKIVKAFMQTARQILLESNFREENIVIESRNRIRAGVSKKNIATKIVTGVSSRAGALVSEAREAGCGSIVVGRTGISQVEEFNIGRVYHKVIQRAENAAVWVVP